MSDKRTVATDALETLGTTIGEHEKRDAIHLAVEPVVAAKRLQPGQRVGRMEGGYGPCEHPVGIVDPFLDSWVNQGERFWLVVYPRQITSLRHVWTHPAFNEEPECTSDTTIIASMSTKGIPGVDDPQVAASKEWIEHFAARIGQSYITVMYVANMFLEFDQETYDNTERYKDAWGEFPEFWKHYETVTGIKPNKDQTGSPFTCSC